MPWPFLLDTAKPRLPPFVQEAFAMRPAVTELFLTEASWSVGTEGTGISFLLLPEEVEDYAFQK